jgi:hypothetical protein
VVETQGSNQWVWGIMKEIQWTQERTMSWNWWSSLHAFFKRSKTGIKVIALFSWHAQWLSFPQNSALDHKSNLHLIFYPSKKLKRVRMKSEIIWLLESSSSPASRSERFMRTTPHHQQTRNWQ